MKKKQNYLLIGFVVNKQPIIHKKNICTQKPLSWQKRNGKCDQIKTMTWSTLNDLRAMKKFQPILLLDTESFRFFFSSSSQGSALAT